jgi:UDP-N-acetylglucosamine/UDP-N-acetylgalactosamine diphosphorylase
MNGSVVVKMDKESLNEYLTQFGQEHLLRFWNDLNESEKIQLHKDVTNTDLAHITKCFAQIKENFKDTSKTLDSLMEPVPEELTGSYSKCSKDELNEYYLKGLEKVASNEVAVLLLAGGQGTRLGVDYPKGMYSVNLASNKTLYQLQAERILRLETLAAKENNKESCVITWYIMTSEATKEATRNYFAKYNFFGLKSENVVFFEQYTLPCLTHEGKIILDSKFKLSKAPDGNGGLYRALLKQDILEDMAKREIKHIHIYCVDNILVKMADPIFIGFCVEKNANCAAKVVKKSSPEEAVGVICKVTDRYQVVEYSEISALTSQERNANGELKFNAGNICNHYFRTDFLDDVCR